MPVPGFVVPVYVVPVPVPVIVVPVHKQQETQGWEKAFRNLLKQDHNTTTARPL
jgi:hypothetical protein